MVNPAFKIERQPDEITCGPTCLHAIYRHYGFSTELVDVIKSVQMLESGGTLAPFLGVDALKRGFKAEIYSFNLKIFDPSWFSFTSEQLLAKLYLQASVNNNMKRYNASDAYIKFLEEGGIIKFQDLTLELIRELLLDEDPILVGLSATYFYKSMRENPKTCDYDDVYGEPTGHFVVGAGLDKAQKNVAIADPFFPNTFASGGYYQVNIEHLICSILLGVVTYDANLLIIKRPKLI